MGAHLISTGNVRPALVTTGAPPRRAATGPVAMVADMTITRRSGRSTSRASRVKARPRSVCRCRSWNSSKTTIPTPGREASDCRRRVSIPSVTTSIRVALPVRRSSLVA